jgi:hypothetical protein
MASRPWPGQNQNTRDWKENGHSFHFKDINKNQGTIISRLLKENQ